MDLSRGQKLLIIGGLLALLAGIVILSLGRLAARPAAVVYEAPPKVAPQSRLIAVHVVGAVANPGLYWLPPGSRVAEAIGLAGGMTGQASAKSVNLAAIVEDGQQIVVGSTPPLDSGLQSQQLAPPPATVPASPPTPQPLPTPAPAAKPSTGTVFPLSLNQATKEQLEAIPEIGPELAQRILYYRYEHGGFRTVEELTNVQGIGEHRMGLLRQYVTP